MKRVISLCVALALSLSLVACGSRSDDASYDTHYVGNGAYMDDSPDSAKASSGIGFTLSSSSSSSSRESVSNSAGLIVDSAESYSAPETYYDSEPDYDESGEALPSSNDAMAQSDTVRTDMLVYRGDVTVTTKDYDESYKDLMEFLGQHDYFIESCSEQTRNSYSTNKYVNLRMTIRIASKDFQDVMDGLSAFGVVESKSTSVENLNIEYSDTVTALRIKQSNLERYLSRLEQETDSEIAMQLEREVERLQVDISQLAARKRIIETDVAYSYIYLRLDEVADYSSQPSYKDTFFVRVWKEIVNTYYDFTYFLEQLLYVVIHLFPYIVILVVVLVILKKRGKLKKPTFKKFSLKKIRLAGNESVVTELKPEEENVDKKGEE